MIFITTLNARLDIFRSIRITAVTNFSSVVVRNIITEISNFGGAENIFMRIGSQNDKINMSMEYFHRFLLGVTSSGKSQLLSFIMVHF